MFPCQRRTDRRNGSFRIKCACHSGCDNAIVIRPGQKGDQCAPITIGGVVGSIDQWRQTFGPLLDMVPLREEPLFEVQVNGSCSFLFLEEAAKAVDTPFAFEARITGRVLEPDMTIRDITSDEQHRFQQIADDWAAKR